MSFDLEPWDTEVLALLDEGKATVEPSVEARARLRYRLDLAIAKEASSPVVVRARPRATSIAMVAFALAACVAIGFGIGRSRHSDHVANSDKSHPTRTYVPPSSSSSVTLLGGLSSNDQELLDDAVVRLTADDPNGALDRLDEHARKHPTGPLTELREALSIEALARAGKRAEARERGAKFFEHYPKSLLAPAVSDALARISDG